MVKQNLFVDGLNSDRVIPAPSANSFLKTDSLGNWEFGTGQETIKYIVDPDGYFGYSTVQAAVDAAEAAGTSFDKPAQIVIWPGDYPDNITINTEGILLSGLSAVGPTRLSGTTTVNITGTSGIFALANVDIYNFSFTSSASFGYFFADTAFLILASPISAINVLYAFDNSKIYSGSFDVLNVSPAVGEESVLFITNSLLYTNGAGRAIAISGAGQTQCELTRSKLSSVSFPVIEVSNTLQYAPYEWSMLELERRGSAGPCISKSGPIIVRIGGIIYYGNGASSDINVTDKVDGIYWKTPYRIRGSSAEAGGELLIEGGEQLTVGGNVTVSGGKSVTGGDVLLRPGDGSTTDGKVKIQNATGSTDYVVVDPSLNQPVNVKVDARFDQDVIISGNLIVDGYTTSVDSEIVNISDNYLYLNSGYTVPVAQSGGIVVNYLPTATATTVGASGFTAGVAGVSNPTVETVGSGTFATNDLIQISGATEPSNDGIFEVLNHVGNILTIRGIGTANTVQAFSQNQFTVSVGAVGTITKVNVSVLRSSTTGNWEYANSSTNNMSFLSANGLKYTVGPISSGAQYQTIQAAINAAELTASPSNIALILVYPGDYTESPVISCGGITIAAFGPSSSTYVFGGITFSPDSTLGAYYTLSNIGVDGYITYSGATSGSGILYLFNCETNDIVFDSTSAGSTLAISDSKVQKVTVNNGDTLSSYNCQTAEIVSSGATSIAHSTVFGSVTHTGSFECTVSNSLIQTSTLDTDNYCISSSATANLRLLNVEFRKNNLLGPIVIKSSSGVVLHSGCHWSGTGSNVTTPISLSGGATEFPPGRPLSPRVGGVVFPQAVSDQLNWPAGVGTAGQTLVTDGVNQLSWQTPSSSGKFNFVVGPAFTGADYLTIQDAIDAAETAGANGNNPATIFVHGGIYTENPVVSSGGINIISSGTNGAYIDGYVNFNIDPSNASYYGLTDIFVLGTVSLLGTSSGPSALTISASQTGNIISSVFSTSVVNIISSFIGTIDLSSSNTSLTAFASNIVFNPSASTAISATNSLNLDGCYLGGKIVLTGSGTCRVTNCTIHVLNQECLNINSTGTLFLNSCGLRRGGTTGVAVIKAGAGVLNVNGVSCFGNLTYPAIPAPSATVVYGVNYDYNAERVNFVRNTTFSDPGISTDADTTRAITIKTGDNTSTTTGAVRLYTGYNTSTGASGDFSVDTGNTVTGTSGNITLNTGDVSTSGTSGSIDINVGDARNSTAGSINLNSGDVISGTGLGGDIRLNAGNGRDNTSGQIILQGAQPSGTNGGGSLIRLSTGAGVGTGTGGNVIIETPTHTVGTGGTGTITISTGSTVVSSTGSTGTLSLSTGSVTNITANTAGNITITAGSSSSTNASSTGGNIDITAGNGTAGGAGRIRLWAGDSSSTGAPGEVNIKAGGRTAGTGTGNSVFIVGGNSRSATGGGVLVNTGVVTGGNAQGGPFTVTTGNGSGAAPGGNVNFILGTGGASPSFSVLHNNVSEESIILTDVTATTKADGYVLAWDNVNNRNYYRDPSSFGGATSSWSSVLAVGNTSGANNAIISSGQFLQLAGTSGIQRTSDSNLSINYASAASAAGGSISITAQNNGGSSTGGSVTISSGGTGSGSSGDVSLQTVGGLGGSSGNINLTTGAGSGGNSGSVNITTGAGGAGTVGAISLISGNGGASPGGDVIVTAGNGGASGGSVTVTAGNGGSGAAGTLSLIGGTSSAGVSGSINIAAGDNSSTFNGGSVTISAGDNTNSGTNAGATVTLSPGTTSAGGNLDLFAGNGGGLADSGGDLTLRAGQSTSGTSGSIIITNSGGSPDVTGQINISTGAATVTAGTISLSAGSGATGGSVNINAGGTTTGSSGNTVITAGTSSDSGSGGNLILSAGSSETGTTGIVLISAGSALTSGNGGYVTITAGSTAGGTGGDLNLNGGDSTGGNGGAVIITGGDGTGGSGAITLSTPNSNSPTGNITLTTGTTTGAPPGDILLTTGNSTGSGSDIIVTVGSSAGSSNGFQVINTGATPSTSLLLTKNTANSRADGYILIWNAGGYNSYLDPATISGSFTGPVSSTDNAVVRFDGTTGDLVQNSSVIIDDSGNITSGNINGVSITAHASRHNPGGSDALATAAAVSLTATTTNTEGTATSFARSDHTHAISSAAPSALVVGGSNTTGTSSSFARADHLHALPAFGTTAGTFAQGNDARFTDDRTASGLRTATTIVSISGATAPIAGQALVATSGTAATWQTVTLTSRTLTAGAGLTGGGDLSADRTFNVGANADGSIVVNADDIQVGVLATDAQHGNRGGGSLHAVATTSVAGFLSAADKTKLDGIATGATNTPLSSTTPVDVTKAAASVGVDTTAARADHKHDVATATAVSVGTTNAEGTSTSLARADHTHAVTGLSIASQAQGDILYYNGSAWVRLPPGTSGQLLQTNGVAANPSWVSVIDTQLNGTANTTDATSTFINAFTVPTTTVIQYEARIVARNTSSFGASGWRISGVFGNNAGTVTQQGVTTIITEEKSDASFAVDFSISGTSVRVQVNGVATTNVSWRVFSSIISV